MKITFRATVAAAGLFASACATPDSADEVCTLAVADVSVLPMDRERVLDGQVVLIGGNRIIQVGAADDVPTRTCAKIIDGTGRFLLPGLTDSHVHVESAALAEAFGAPPQPIDFPKVLSLYLAHGVTTVRVMSGAPDLLAFRDHGEGLHSRLVVGSPMLSGHPPVLPEPATKIVRTADAARDAARGYAAEGYDFIKVRDNLGPAVFRAVVAEAERAGLYVDGHIQNDVAVDEVLASGQKGFAHIDNFALELGAADDAGRFIEALGACGCFVATTLSVEANAVRQIDDYETLLARPEMRYMHPLLKRAFWLKPNNPYVGADRAFFASLLQADMRLVKTFSDGGVRLVAGTDALSPMIIPGISLHEELALLIEAGLTPYQAIATATANPAAYIPGLGNGGAVTPGRRADLILVDGNPLADPAVLRRPSAVILGGRLIERHELDRMLEEAAAAFGAVAD